MRKGSTLSKENKQKISLALKGRISPMKGKILSKDTKLKMSIAHKESSTAKEIRQLLLSYAILPKTKEHRNKISLASRGNKSRIGKLHTIEAKQKISSALKGREFSDEHRRHLKIAAINKFLDPVKKEKHCLLVVKRGNDHPYWRGGISKLPYPFEFNKNLKEKIKLRDGYICQLCDCSNPEKLVIHHIDYNKSNLSDDNLITLCYPCNFKVNRNRNYWTTYFNNNIVRRL